MINIQMIRLKDWNPIGRELEKRFLEETTFWETKVLRYGVDLIGIENEAFPITFNLTTKEFIVWARGGTVEGWENTEENREQLKRIALEWFEKYKGVFIVE